MKSITAAYFAPQLIFKEVLPAMEFYIKAFGAAELRRWSNPDGSVHVAEMQIEGAMFHLHEESTGSSRSPEALGGSTCLIGIFVDDVFQMVRDAEAAGGRISSPVQDFDYGYRQGIVVDPFGHHWLIESKI